MFRHLNVLYAVELVSLFQVTAPDLAVAAPAPAAGLACPERVTPPLITLMTSPSVCSEPGSRGGHFIGSGVGSGGHVVKAMRQP